MSVCCFQLMLLVIYCLWVLIFISIVQIQRRTIGALRFWGHVSPRTCAALLANAFIPARGIHYTAGLINVKMGCVHIWSWKPCRGRTLCVCLFKCVRGEGRSGGGGGVDSLFFILGISASQGLAGAIKSRALSVTWCAECNCWPLGLRMKAAFVHFLK